MGLDTSHDCWHGPYSAFDRWRSWLAGQIGIVWEFMDGVSKTDKFIYWDALNDDPALLVLNHSDCDGRIRWFHCKALAIRLGQVYRQSKDELGHGGMECRRACYDSMRRATLRFAIGCLHAWRERSDVIFR